MFELVSMMCGSYSKWNPIGGMFEFEEVVCLMIQSSIVIKHNLAEYISSQYHPSPLLRIN